MFATHGLPRVVISDNGSVFTSSGFQEFMTKNDICHIRIAPYHPPPMVWQRGECRPSLKEGLKELSSGTWKPDSSVSCFNTKSHLTLLQVNPQLNCSRCNSCIHTLINFILIWLLMWNKTADANAKV